MTGKARGAWFLLAGLVLSAAIGCNEDNERTAKITSVAPPPGAAPPPRSQAEAYQQNQGINYKGSGYPGARR